MPEELVPGAKRALGYEMRPEAQERLHDSLAQGQLKSALAKHGLAVSGSKTEMSVRLMKAGVKPSEVLGSLKTEELYELCGKLRGVSVGGKKEEKIQRIIGHFSSLSFKQPECPEDPRSILFEHIEEFARRENSVLYSLGLIKRDIDMEKGFEEGTRYLFEAKLGQTLLEMDGTDHPDGGCRFQDGELLLWDNKSKESRYTFPKAHFDQFKRYIKAARERVKVFVVIVPDVAPEAELQAMKLKCESERDTDVALITAADLKFVADNWRKQGKAQEFSLQVFNATGLLDRSGLIARMKVFLA